MTDAAVRFPISFRLPPNKITFGAGGLIAIINPDLTHMDF